MVKKHLRYLLALPTLLVILLATTAFTQAPTAHAAPITKESTVHVARVVPNVCVPGLRVQYVGVTEEGPYAQVSGYNGTENNSTLHMGTTKTVSNTLTAEIGFSVAEISAKVGFSVTASTAVAFDWTITVPSHETGYIYAYADFWTYLLTNTCSGAQAVAEGFDNGIYYDSWTQ